MNILHYIQLFIGKFLHYLQHHRRRYIYIYNFCHHKLISLIIMIICFVFVLDTFISSRVR
jgi:hypothetical protein